MPSELDPSITGQAMDNIANNPKFAKLVRQYGAAPDSKKGELLKRKIVEDIAAEIVKATRFVFDMEMQAAQTIRARLQIDSLTTDTQGARTIQQLNEGLPFATGTATRCVVVAVAHPEIGMGASHKNTVTQTVIKKMVEASLEDNTFMDTFGRTGDETVGLGIRATPPNSLKQTMNQTLNEAFQQFSRLNQNRPLPAEGLSILSTGMDFLDPALAAELEHSFQEMISTHPSFHDGSMLGRNRQVKLQTAYGRQGGVIWGGPNSTQYPQPIIYNIETK